MEETVIVLMGLPQAGKSTSARIIQKLTGWKSGTCSTIIYGIMARFLNLPEGDWHKIIPENQHKDFRTRMVSLGNAVSDQVPHIYPMALYEKGCRILDGIRRRQELLKFQEYCDDKGVKLIKIWLVRKDQPDIQDNTEVVIEDSDIVICPEHVSNLHDLLEKELRKLNIPILNNE